MPCILAIDQGTTGTTCLVVEGPAPVRVLGRGYAEFPQHFSRPGWVEHELDEIWTSVLVSARNAIVAAGSPQLDAVGITNQRETACIWDERGRPVHRAIVWQDRRTADRCAKLKPHADMLRQRTGLVIDPYFSGTKVGWLLDEVPGLRERAARGQLRFGTVDAWLVHKLTGGAVHVTDITNACRTQLFDIHRRAWDPELCALLGDIPASMLPRVVASNAVVGHTVQGDVFPAGTPIAGLAGDQQAALFGQACVREGMAKCTYGTGAFALVHTGERAADSPAGLITTVALQLGDRVTYALEGSVFVAGAVVQWLRDGLGMFSSSAEVEALAEKVPDAGGVTLVPALTGLGAPHWKPQARGLIAGITRGTNRGHIARAALEGIAFQVSDLLAAMNGKAPLKSLRVDGGAAANNLLMQFQADLLGLHIERPRHVDTTALGAAFLAGLGVGIFADVHEVEAAWACERTFTPDMPRGHAQARMESWREAVLKA